MDEKDYQNRATHVVEQLEDLTRAIIAGGSNPDEGQSIVIGIARATTVQAIVDMLQEVVRAR